MPKTIVVPLDGSHHAERALEPARMLADQSGSDLVLVMSRLGGLEDPLPYLESAARGSEPGKVRIVAFDDRLAVESILTVADAEPEPVVCMTTHARSGPGLVAFGSVTEAVMRRTDVPLVLVGPSVAETAGTMMFEEVDVCIDHSPASDSIVPVAAEWAAGLGLGVWVVSVIEPGWSAEAVRQVGSDLCETTLIHKVARDLQAAGLDTNWEVLHGSDPAEAIVQFARSRPSPLLAMATHGRTGLARVTAGSVTMSVVHHAPCPVLVTRSRYFNS